MMQSGYDEYNSWSPYDYDSWGNHVTKPVTTTTVTTPVYFFGERLEERGYFHCRAVCKHL